MPDDFQIEAILHDGASARICRAIRRSDGEPFILKSPRPGNGESLVVVQLAHERRIWELLGLWPEGTVTLEAISGIPTLIRPELKGEPLDACLEKLSPGDLVTRLRILRGLCRSLGRLHEQGIIHKDINPANLLWNEDSGEIVIIDFGIAACLRDEATEPAPPSVLEGTLAYISPEQTGRLRRTIDARTDLYSLGATAHEIFAGRPPFEADDLASMVHAHLAVVPRRLSDMNPEIPEVISDIVAKLLSKEPEKRYRTAAGLTADIDRCLLELSSKKSQIDPFTLGANDPISAFQIPERLYGREAEIDRLLGGFSDAMNGEFRITLISGYSGIGKTALVNQIQAPVLQWRSQLVSGKFDQLRRNIPYATLVQAFRSLIRLNLKESDQKIADLKAELTAAIGRNAQLLIDVIPELELIIGPQPAVPPLPPSEAQNRFHRTLCQFVKVFANERHPLVLFLDDLQWTGTATLEVIERFATEGNLTHLFLIGAYRDNEVGPGHPLHSLLGRLRNSDVKCETIALEPLDSTAVTALVADTLHRDPPDIAALAEICLAKTGGNPFFLNQFLHSLNDRSLVRFSKESQRWEWDEENIRNQHVTENVVDLMALRISRLQPKTQRILRLASAIGDRFDLKTLAIIAGLTSAEALDDLWEALNESFVLPLDARYRYAGLSGEGIPAGTAEDSNPAMFRFLHDRVRQACYDEIPEAERDALHLEIGRLMVERLSADEVQERLFDVVNHYNTGVSLISDLGEKRKLAALNLTAGQKAKDSAAYQPALAYLECALRLLGKHSWATDFSLCLQIHVHAVQARYLCLDYEGMDTLAAEVLKHARTPIDRAAVEEVRIQALMARNQPIQAIHLALPVLRSLGVRLPSRPGQIHILAGLAATEFRLRKRPVESLINLPEMTDPAKLAAMRILYFVFSSCYFAFPQLYPLIMFEIIRISLAYGITPAASVGFSAYGVVQCGLLRRIDHGNRFGKLSLDLIERFAAREIKARVIQVTQGFVTVWRTHPENLLQDFLDAYETGMDSGDFEFASFTAHMRCFFLLWIGVPLKTVEQEMARYGDIIAGTKQSIPLYQHNLWRQFAANLRGEARDPVVMTGEHYDETVMTAIHEEANDAIALFFLQCCKLILGVLHDHPETALAAANRGEEMQRRGTGMGSTTVPIFLQFSSIAWLRAARQLRGRERSRFLSKARSAIGKLKKWADCSPIMAGSKHALAAAELASAEGRPNDAINWYQSAIELGREHRNPVDIAFALHLLTEFHRERNQSGAAQVYFSEACREYRQWQADGVLSHFRAKHADLASHSPAAAALSHSPGSDSTWSQPPNGIGIHSAIDLTSVIKSVQALSGEIILEQLLRKLMRIMLENAGADRGALILLKDGRLLIEAQGSVDEDEITVLQSIPLSGQGLGCPPAPADVIQYVARTQEPVILEDAAQVGNFTTEPYIAARLCRSLICIPLVNQGRLIGVLELENSATRNAFSPDRVTMLRALSVQAAISIENARLYAGLDALNRAYAPFVPHEFLDILEKKSITEIRLGDQTQGTMSVLFSDIRGFTSLSEKMTPEENFQFVNRYLSHMEPAFFEHRGFIDKYVGDAIMGIFPKRADDAVQAAIQMLKNLKDFNEDQRAAGAPPVSVGIGINTGKLMIGVVGGPSRLDTTVISDSVNLASRLESLSRVYGISLLISEHTYQRLGNAPFTDYIRKVDRVIPKGSTSEIDVYEVFAVDDPMSRDLKAETAVAFQEACREFAKGRHSKAKKRFQELLQRNPEDRVVQCYLERCEAPAPPNGPGAAPAKKPTSRIN